MGLEPNNNKMAVEKIEGSVIEARKAFAELRSQNSEQIEIMFGLNTALYKLDQKISDAKKIFKGE